MCHKEILETAINLRLETSGLDSNSDPPEYYAKAPDSIPHDDDNDDDEICNWMQLILHAYSEENQTYK